MNCKNLTSPRSGRPVANQFEINHNGEKFFQSYRVIVAKYDASGRLFLDSYYWDYSRTTARYRNQFTGLTTDETKKGIKDGSIVLCNLN